MNQHDLKKKIAETLLRNAHILAMSELRYDAKGFACLRQDSVENMLRACAANLAQALPEMLVSAGEKIKRADYVEMREERDRLRELCKHAHAALMMLQDYKGSPLCDDLKKACGDAE